MKRSAFVLAALLLALPACQSKSTGRVPGAERTDGFPAPDKEIVFDVAIRTLRQQGYSIDIESSSPQSGTIVTRWLTSLAPFSGQGKRDMATIWIRDVPGRANYYVVEANVTRESNMEMIQPSNPVKAEWSAGERVPELEQVLVKRIESYFLSNDASASLKESYGLQGGYDPRLKDPNLDPVPPAGR